MSFSAFKLCPSLLSAIESCRWHEPTPVQAEVIPAILAKRDVWASSQTGSGKTGSYLVPLVELLQRVASRQTGETSALIVLPTRELASQVADVAARLVHQSQPGLKICLAIGGISINPQMMSLRGGTDILIGTPGRLLDLIDHNALNLSGIRSLVLDEADRLLRGGFAQETERLLSLLPDKCQNLLFSATLPPQVQQLAKQLLNDPVEINLDTGQVPATDLIAQRAIEVDSTERTALLKHLLSAENLSRVLVFVESRKRSNNLADKLKSAGIAAAPLHGELSQGTRSATLASFHDGHLQVLVATDVAARGLDIAELPVVLNYDLPRSTPDFLHRIGRTGRAEHHGQAITFVSPGTEAHLCLIEKRHTLLIPREQIEGFAPTEQLVTPLDPQGGIKGYRMSKKDKLRAAAARLAEEKLDAKDENS